ncbi:glycoside hydrolase family 105 protein [Paenibacillus septentrionalis]|uniref:Glycoside hydrolase family 105 protein n=1 Tax=Paenibacillus septentrionalis TaxID=429342 RepID=A0ABW1V7L2_9BACL
MFCGEFKRSSYSRFEQQDHEVLLTMARRYMEAQPAEPYTFRISSTDGLKRDLEYRYNMNMSIRFDKLENGQFIYACAKLWSDEETELPFSLSCYGPVTIFVNGKLAYQANIEEEVFPERRSWFRLKLQAGWNHFVWQFMKTGTGCGAKFGSGSIKGFPLHFIVPFGEAEGAEGILYTSPIAERRLEYAASSLLASDSRVSWYPRMTWNEEELLQLASERIFGLSRGRAMLAWTSVIAQQAGRYRLSGQCKGKLLLICNGMSYKANISESSNEVSTFELELQLVEGTNDLFMWMIEQNGHGFRWDRLRSLEEEARGGVVVLEPQLPVQVEGYSGSLLYSGPYAEPFSIEKTLELQNMAALHPCEGGASYWRVDAPNSFVRPFAERTHFGRWNYPLGVTLYGLLRLENEEAHQYAHAHIACCSSYNNYAYWDAEQFGAPGINHQLVGMDSLDDCGSFGATMLYANSLQPLDGAEELAARIAHYISDEQSRLDDGTLYRIKGSTNFMKDTMWCDDLYMSVPFLVRYFLMTGDERYINDAAHQLLQYKKYLFEPALRIMHHVYDLKFNAQNGAYWGRGNGWVLFSLAELLRHIEASHPRREELLDMFRELSEGYLGLQDGCGLWHQVLNDHESYEESSCTSMFAYAFAIGVQQGWYENAAPYISSVRKAWTGLMQRAIDEDGNVYGVCRGSGFAHHSYYYKYDLMPRLNDTHGIGIIMLAGIETGQMEKWLRQQSANDQEVRS